MAGTATPALPVEPRHSQFRDARRDLAGLPASAATPSGPFGTGPADVRGVAAVAGRPGPGDCPGRRTVEDRPGSMERAPPQHGPQSRGLLRWPARGSTGYAPEGTALPRPGRGCPAGLPGPGKRLFRESLQEREPQLKVRPAVSAPGGLRPCRDNMPTALISHPDFLLHDTGPFHPERPDRMTSVLAQLGLSGDVPDGARQADLLCLSPAPAGEARIKAVHDGAYVDAVVDWCGRGYRNLPTGDTTISSASETVARLAAGAAMRAVDAVLTAEADRVFCVTRPPGHHAESDRGMGFCIYNNAAVAARYAQSRFGVERVAVLDWDVHHGNGTQEIFEEDPSVYYFSVHQYPLYPFTGAERETGTGEGAGYTMNVPVSAGSGDEVFIDVLRGTVLPAMKAYQPDLLILSAGFDAHMDDPLSGTLVTDAGFRTMTRLVLDFVEDACGGRLVSV
ncbi:MAG: histone deacetylase, partial [Gemmatimonadetes bacterium]|nr:histone deacetylase [Gemmatimonadota bacterium]